MIGPVAVHDGQPLGAVIFRACLGDICDAAVEERAFAAQPRIDQVGAFVGSPAPVGRRDDPAFGNQTVLQGHVVKVAAHRQPVIAAGADVSVNQHFSAAIGPGGPAGRIDVRECRLGQRIGSGRLEQAVVAQIGRDDAGEFDPERGSAFCIGRSADIAVGRKGRDGNAEIVEIALEGNRTGQAALFLDCLDRLTFGQGFTKILILCSQRSGHQR